MVINNTNYIFFFSFIIDKLGLTPELLIEHYETNIFLNYRKYLFIFFNNIIFMSLSMLLASNNYICKPVNVNGGLLSDTAVDCVNFTVTDIYIINFVKCTVRY